MPLDVDGSFWLGSLWLRLILLFLCLALIELALGFPLLAADGAIRFLACGLFGRLACIQPLPLYVLVGVAVVFSSGIGVAVGLARFLFTGCLLRTLTSLASLFFALRFLLLDAQTLSYMFLGGSGENSFLTVLALLQVWYIVEGASAGEGLAACIFELVDDGAGGRGGDDGAVFVFGRFLLFLGYYCVSKCLHEEDTMRMNAQSLTVKNASFLPCARLAELRRGLLQLYGAVGLRL